MNMQPQGGQEPTLPKKDLWQDRRQIGIPMLAIGFIFIGGTVLQILLAYLIARFAPGFSDSYWYSWVLSMLPMYLITMPLSLLFYRAVPRQEIPRREIPFPIWLCTLSLCFGLTYLGSIVGNILNSVIASLSGEVPENALQTVTEQSPTWIILLFVGILAPILEEIFFRKLLIERLCVYGDLPAVLISGILFGLMHGNFYQFFYAASLGIVMGYVYIRTGKLRYTIALHMSINIVGSVYTSEMLKKLDLTLLEQNPTLGFFSCFGGISMMAAYYVFLGLVVISLPFAIFFLRKRIRMRRGARRLTAQEWVRVLLFNPATWCVAVIASLLFFFGL